jgi:hypothetical protein
MRFVLTIVCLLMMALLPSVVVAAPSFGVGITATGNDPGGLPGPPTLTATLVSNTQVDLTWVAGIGATGTVVRARYGTAPTAPTEGYAVYTGVGLAATDWIPNIEFSDNVLWYSAWSYNGIGYSVTYDTASVGGTDMADAITMIAVCGFFLVGVAINIGGWWARKWWLCPIAFFYFIGLAFFCYTQSAASTGATTFDFYRFLIWACGGFALVSLGELWYLYQSTKEGEEPEDDMVTKNRKRMESNLKNTFNRQRPQAVVRKRPPSVGDGL